MRLPHLCVLPRHYTDWCEQHAVGCHLNPLARKHLDETLVGGVGAVSESIGFRKAIYIYVYMYTRIHLSSSVQALYIGAHRLNTMPYLPHSFREVGIYISSLTNGTWEPSLPKSTASPFVYIHIGFCRTCIYIWRCIYIYKSMSPSEQASTNCA